MNPRILRPRHREERLVQQREIRQVLRDWVRFVNFAVGDWGFQRVVHLPVLLAAAHKRGNNKEGVHCRSLLARGFH